MRPISPAVRGVLAGERRMKRCAVAPLQDVYGPCEDRITKPEWHHVWKYAGRQIDEPWAIVAGCSGHHRMAADPAVQAVFERASLAVATDEDLARYPRKNWRQIKRSLGIA